MCLTALVVHTGPLIYDGKIIGIYSKSIRRRPAETWTCFAPAVRKVVYVNLAAPAINDLIVDWLTLR